MNTFYTDNELKRLGIKRYGSNVLISRNAILYHPHLLEIGNNVRIDDFVTVSGQVVLGNYIHIAQFVGLYGGESGIFMEDFTGISSKTCVYATTDDYSGQSLTNPTTPEEYRKTEINKPVYFRKHSIIGCMSTILPGVTIGEGSSVGAMSLCNKSIDPWSIYAGVPAKKLKERSKHILELEQKLLLSLNG